jgi:hypothetical protein
MPTLTFVTPEELAIRDRKIERLEKLLEAYVSSQDEWLDTAAALRTTGIKARSTLAEYMRADVPGVAQEGRITYKKEGTKCLYLRSSCIDYRQRKHGQPALAA